MKDFQKLKFKDFNTLINLTKNCTSFEVYSIHYDNNYKPSIEYIIDKKNNNLVIYNELSYSVINGNHNIIFLKNINKYEKNGYTYALNKDSMSIYDLYYNIIDTKFIFISYCKINNKNEECKDNNKTIIEEDLTINEI